MASNEMAQSALTSGISKAVRPLLDLVDELRALGIEQELALPQIAVMGDQSSGKSSVLEALSGVPFPRGTGLVTRCPCQLTMKKKPSGTKWSGEVGVQRNGEYTRVGQVSSPAELTAAIERVTETLTQNSSSGFSRDSIVVGVESDDVPDLTIIDLPGIVRTVTYGQDRGVITTVNEMIESYLKQERTIVLAIVPANQDVATVDILERAQRVDPSGERTIGVLTKPDLVDPGGEDECVATLENKRKPLKLGYVMVKNRNAAELKKAGQSSGSEQTESERRYFREHEAYSKVDASLLGIPNLTTKLTSLLAKRIEAVLPELKWELQEHLTDADKQLKKIGAPPPEDPLERSKLVLRILSDYTAVLRQTARGDYRHELLARRPDLRLRTTADVLFHDMESGLAQLKPDFDAPDFAQKLHHELRALRGRELPGLLNSFFFYGFMARHVEMWRPLVKSSKNALYDLSFSVAAQIAEEVFTAYPGAVNVVSNVINAHLEQSTEAIQTKIEEVFKHESDPFISKNELAEAILKVRFDRFEKALEAVMLSVGSGPPDYDETPPAEKEEKQKDNAAAATSEAKLEATAANSSTLEGTSQKATVEMPVEEEEEADGAHPMQEIVLNKLGKWYMANHGVTSMAMVQDMRTVLVAYWGVAAKRITENVCMLFETFLLASLAENLEQRLLELVQENKGNVVDQLLAQDEATKALRLQLKAKKNRVATALNTLSKFAPGCVARKRRGDDEAAEVVVVDKKGATVKVPPAPVTAPLTSKAAIDAPLKKLPEGQSVLAKFGFTSSGDNGGFIYWLGTSGKQEKKFTNPHDAGRIRVTSSGLSQGTESTLVSRRKTSCMTRDEPGAWICLDLGRNRAMVPTHYTLLSGSDQPGFDLLSWNLEGYDADADAWVDLHRPSSTPRTLTSPWGVATFELRATSRPWRYLRLHHTGLNARGTHVMAVSAWEFYGDLIQVKTA